MSSKRFFFTGALLLLANAALIASILLYPNPEKKQGGGEIVVDTSAERARLERRAECALALGNAAHAFGFFDEAAPALASAAEFDKTSAAAKYLIGDSMLESDMPEEGAAALSEAVKIIEARPPDNSAIDGSFHADAYHALGDANRICEKFQAAEKYYREAAEHSPDSSFFLSELGNILYRNGERAEAAEAYKRAAAADADWRGESKAIVYYNLATLSYRFGNVEEAKTYLKKVLEIDPSITVAREYLELLSAPQPNE